MKNRSFSQPRNKGSLSLTALCLTMVLSGCVPPPLTLDTTSNLPAEFQGQADLAEFDSIIIDDVHLARWWEQFQDPVLTELVHQALTNSKDIQLALTRVEQERAMERSSRAAWLPHVGAAIGAQRHSGLAAGTGTATISQWQGDLQASWEIDLFGAGRERLSAAQYRTQASMADVYAIRLSLVAAVASHYLDYRGTQQQYQLLQESLQQAHEFLNIAQRSFVHGLGRQTDIHMAQADIAQLQAQMRQTSARMTLLRLGLENLCMVVPGSFEKLLGKPRPLPNIPLTIAQGQPVDLLMRRPDLLAAQFRLRSALSQSQAARNDYLPRLTLSALFGSSGMTVGGMSQSNDRVWLSGLSAVLPLFDFGTRGAQVQLSDARSQEALLAYQKSAMDALFDVERALLQLTRDREIYSALSSQVQERQQVVRQVYRQFELGAVGRLDVAQARVTLLESQMALLAQNVLRQQTQVSLFRALGGAGR